jgi:RNA polymerase sigma-70 factor (ECF subfamily)
LGSLLQVTNTPVRQHEPHESRGAIATRASFVGTQSTRRCTSCQNFGDEQRIPGFAGLKLKPADEAAIPKTAKCGIAQFKPDGNGGETLASCDEELIAAYQKLGQEQAVDELLRRYVGKVRALVYQMVLNDSDADDLTQEILLRAFRGLSGFNGKSQFSTWLYRVAMNATYSFLDRRGRSPVSYQAQPPESLEASASQPDRAAMQAELEGKVGAALAELSPKLRAAIVLTTIQQMSPAEAAEIEGCSTATIYWRIHEARKLLKRRLEEYL